MSARTTAGLTASSGTLRCEGRTHSPRLAASTARRTISGVSGGSTTRKSSASATTPSSTAPQAHAARTARRRITRPISPPSLTRARPNLNDPPPMPAPRPVGPAILLLALAVRAAHAVDPADVTVARLQNVVRVETSAVRADVRLARCRLLVRDRATGALLTREQNAGGLFYERAAAAHALGTVTDVELLPDGARLTVDTDEGSPATVTVRFLTRRTLEVALDPPSAATVDAFGERLRSPRRELIYGLTERLRDSPPISPGILDQPVDDIMPPEVGSLDRR